MKKIKVLHQVLDPSGAGGVSAEFRALQGSSLSEKYCFEAMVLKDFHAGLNLHDIKFYYKRIKESQPDIVHVRGAAIDGLNAVIAARLAGHCKVLTTVHGMYSDLVYISKTKRWVSKNIVERAIYTLSHGISCVCKNATDRSYFDKYRNKMLPFVYNRIPTYDLSIKSVIREDIRREYNISSESVVCVFVGRMTREKGLLTMERMFERHHFPDNLYFLFVGDGDYRKTFEEKCKTFSVKTIFVGMQKNVKSFYMASDFFIQPSLHENHSIALLEACAAGIPSIATNCGGNNEIVFDGFTGFVTPVDDDNKLHETILHLMENNMIERLSRNVVSMKYTQFSNAECDKALDRVYQQIQKK